MFKNLIEITISNSVVILCLLFLSPLIKKRYIAKWRYFAWLFIAIRLIIPLNFSLSKAPIIVTPPTQTMIYQNEVVSHEITESPLPNEPATLQTKHVNTTDLFVAIWISGIVAFLLYQLFRYYSFKKSVKRWSYNISDTRITDIFNALLIDMNIQNSIEMKLCKKVCSPMLFGFFKPTLLLPSEDYTDRDLVVILKHELIHYKRHDLWYKLILMIANAVHWFNPIVYVMQRVANRDIEFSCDDEVIKNTDIHFRKSYSKTILNSLHNEKLRQTKLSTYFHGSKRNLKHRFSNILDMTKKRKGILALMMVVILIMAGSVLVACKVGDKVKDTVNNQENVNNNDMVTSFDKLQKSVDNGHQPWRLNPKDVAIQFIRETLKIEDGEVSEVSGNFVDSRVIFKKADGSSIAIDLYQPAKKGIGGIWEVESWFDNNNKKYQVRDLSSLPPLFHHDDTIPQKYKEPIKNYIITNFTKTYKPYYEVLGFESKNVTFIKNKDNIEATFWLIMITKNYYKDPDTVDYIKKAKETGNKYYQTLYDEYNAPRGGSYELKLTANLLTDGSIDTDTFKLYTNVSPKGTEWEYLEDLSGYIISDVKE